MTAVSAAAPTMPAQASAAPGAADPSAAEGAVDFAAVLKAQIAQPAKDALGAEILAALPAVDTDAAEEAVPAEALPAAPDLTTLLPALAAFLPQTPEEAVAGTNQPSATSGGTPSLGAAPNGATAQNPIQAVQAGTDIVKEGQAAPPTALTARPGPTSGALPAPVEAAGSLPHESQMPATPVDATVAAHAAAPLAHAAPAAEAPSVVRVDTPVGTRGWDAEIGQKIVLMANRQESRAELTLTPPQLGRVEVSITMNGDQTSAAFVSASPAAREALEQALPRLREILAEAGITLGQASVNAESAPRDGNGTPAERRGSGGEDSRGTASAGGAAPAQWLRRSDGLVDTFA